MRRTQVRGGDGLLHSASSVLSLEEWGRWLLGVPEPVSGVAAGQATVEDVVALQAGAA